MSFFIIAYFYSSTELEKSIKQVLPGREEGEGERVGVWVRGRNDSNNVCTCE
jgi:hypothetical protein